MQNVFGFRHEHAADLVLVNGHRQNVFGCQNGFVARLGQSHATSLTAMSDLHLGLDHARIADSLGSLGHLMRILSEYGLGVAMPCLRAVPLPDIPLEIHELLPFVTVDCW